MYRFHLQSISFAQRDLNRKIMDNESNKRSRPYARKPRVRRVERGSVNYEARSELIVTCISTDSFLPRRLSRLRSPFEQRPPLYDGQHKHFYCDQTRNDFTCTERKERKKKRMSVATELGLFFTVELSA